MCDLITDFTVSITGIVIFICVFIPLGISVYRNRKYFYQHPAMGIINLVMLVIASIVLLTHPYDTILSNSIKITKEGCPTPNPVKWKI
jgi:ABC-type Fe3+-siderophore transport system permease subunit